MMLSSTLTNKGSSICSLFYKSNHWSIKSFSISHVKRNDTDAKYEANRIDLTDQEQSQNGRVELFT